MVTILLLALLVFPAAGHAATKVRLALQWYPQAQFAGYYMALKKGFYIGEGLDVTILPGSADTNSLDRVISGEADFCTAFLSAALERRSKGAPLVNVGQIVHRSALMLVARKDSGIKTVQDLNGKRIGTWGNIFELQPKALFKREHLDVTLVRQSPSFELFMRGGLDAVMAMWYNEYHRLMSYGLSPDDMVTFFFSDLDLNQPEDGIYCLNSTLENSPQTALSLARASAEGWKYVFAHPEESLDTVLAIMKKANIRANRAHQKWMLDRMQNIILAEGQTQVQTKLDKHDFLQTENALRTSGVLTTPISYEDFYKGTAQ